MSIKVLNFGHLVLDKLLVTSCSLVPELFRIQNQFYSQILRKFYLGPNKIHLDFPSQSNTIHGHYILKFSRNLLLILKKICINRIK